MDPRQVIGGIRTLFEQIMLCAESGAYRDVIVLSRVLAENRAKLQGAFQPIADKIDKFVEHIRAFAETPEHPWKFLDEARNINEELFPSKKIKPMSKQERKKKLLQLLSILKEARALALEGKKNEAKNLISKSFGKLELQVLGSRPSDKWDLARNAIVNMCYELSGGEKFKEDIKKGWEAGEKDSARLIAELEEELEKE